MKDLPFDTLILSNKAKDRWYPTPIDTLRKSIKIDTDIENATALHNNIAYNLQYIEFLEKEFKELHLSSVIYTMVVKNYLITGMSILEGLFTNIIKSNGCGKPLIWRVWDIHKLMKQIFQVTNILLKLRF